MDSWVNLADLYSCPKDHDMYTIKNTNESSTQDTLDNEEIPDYFNFYLNPDYPFNKVLSNNKSEI